MRFCYCARAKDMWNIVSKCNWARSRHLDHIHTYVYIKCTLINRLLDILFLFRNVDKCVELEHSALNRLKSTSNGPNNNEQVEKSSSMSSSPSSSSSAQPAETSGKGALAWPAWVYCTRYSDRPSSGETQLLMIFERIGVKNLLYFQLCI